MIAYFEQTRLGTRVEQICKEVSASVTKAFIMPIATHNLLNEEKIGKNYNELVDSSIEVVKIIMSVMPHEIYFKHLSTLVMNPKQKPKLAKQYERILIAVMDAFHFDLNAAVCVKPVDNSELMEISKETSPKIDEKVAEENIIATEENLEPIMDLETETTGEEAKLFEEVLTVRELTVLTKSAAVRSLSILKSVIIPHLRRYLNFEEKATHKLSRAEKTVDEDVILKIPCTIALVKLLKKLPKSQFEDSIRSIIPCLCAGLRNPLLSVRNTLRKTLLHVIKELGTHQLRIVLSFLKSTLLRGYQRHVLHYTVSYLLKCLEPELRKNPEHLPIKDIIPFCEEELYSVMHEEKDLTAIKEKTREACRSNAVPLLRMCGRCVGRVSDLKDMVEPALRHLKIKKTARLAKVARTWLNSVGEGVTDNMSVESDELVLWLQGVLDKRSEGGIDICPESKGKKKGDSGKKSKYLEEPKDAMLLPQKPKKNVGESKEEVEMVLKEFVFGCVYNGLNSKSGRMKKNLVKSDQVYVLDGLVESLISGVKCAAKQVRFFIVLMFFMRIFGNFWNVWFVGEYCGVTVLDSTFRVRFGWFQK